jgi:hypothetical protein
LLELQGRQWGLLTDRTLHERTTTMPWPVASYAQAYHRSAVAPLPAWNAHVTATQEQLAGLQLSPKLTLVGVSLRVSPLQTRDADKEIKDVAGILAGGGIGGRPATPREMQYLLTRSFTLGAPPPTDLPATPGGWGPDDLATFTDATVWTKEPGDEVVRVESHVNGRTYTRFVAVLAMHELPTFTMPGSMPPWMQLTDRLNFPVEWSRMSTVPDPASMMNRIRLAGRKLSAQYEHFVTEHDEAPPEDLPEQQKLQAKVATDTASGDLMERRLDSWPRCAVSGKRPEQALARARKVTDLYAKFEIVMEPVRRGSYHVAREFIPGEKLANKGHRRQMSAGKYGTGLPQVTARVGHRQGDLFGRTVGTSGEAALWDMFSAQEGRNDPSGRSRSGVTVAVGGLGAGKSTLIASAAFHAALSGVQTKILDPGGPLGQLADLPALAGYATATNLLAARPGTLSPYRVIAEPRRDHYDTDAEWKSAVAWAGARRELLCMSVLIGLLPPAVAALPETRKVLKGAIRQVPPSPLANPFGVIGLLYKDRSGLREHAAYIAMELASAAKLPQCSLIFPDQAVQPDPVEGDGPMLEVLTLRGNVVPKEGIPRAEWSDEERVGHLLQTLAVFRTTEWDRTLPPNTRSLLAIDEAQVMAELPLGRAHIRTVSHDSRKRDTRLILAAPEPGFAAACGISNRIDNVFAGRMEDEQAAKEALAMMHIAVTPAVVRRMMRLSEDQPGEFIWWDGMGGCEPIQILRPALAVPAMNTTPRAETADALVGA